MALQPFWDEQLNYFKFATIVLDEFPNALRQTFKFMWDTWLTHHPGHQSWDDSDAVRELFFTLEGGITEVPTKQSYEEWDCTSLLQATIYANSFRLRNSRGRRWKLAELFIAPLELDRREFHASVTSPTGSEAETLTLAIDQIGRLRNVFFHRHNSKIDKATFDQYVQYAKDALKALGVKTDRIDSIGGSSESEFPTNEVRKLEERIKEGYLALTHFLLQQRPQLEDISSDVKAIKLKVDVMPTTCEIVKVMQQMIEDSKQTPAQNKPGKWMFSFDNKGLMAKVISLDSLYV